MCVCVCVCALHRLPVNGLLTFDFVSRRAQKTIQVMDHKKFQVRVYVYVCVCVCVCLSSYDAHNATYKVWFASPTYALGYT